MIFEMVVVLRSGVIYKEVTRKKWSLKWWCCLVRSFFTSHCRQNSDHPLLLQPDAEQTAAATCPRGASQPETIPADEQAAVTAADRSGCE